MSLLEKFLITSSDLQTIYYIPDYISREEEASLTTNINSSRSKWNVVNYRKVQNHGGFLDTAGRLIAAPLPTYLQRITHRISQETKIWGEDIEANHVLVNEYQPGDGILSHEDGPMYYPATAILSLNAATVIRFHPKTSSGVDVEELHNNDNNSVFLETSPLEASSSSSIPSHNNNKDKPPIGVALMPRSLLIFKDSAYANSLHGIDLVTEDVVDGTIINASSLGLKEGDVLSRRGVRLSLTIRYVPHISKGIQIKL